MGGGQSRNTNLDMSPEDPPILRHESSQLETDRPTDVRQGVVEGSARGYSHVVQLHALNFELAETPIRVDDYSTLSQISFLLYTSDAKTLPVALEQTCGPFPKWSIPNINSTIDRGSRKVYVADITEPFTLALVRDMEEDFPLLIPLASFNDSTATVGDLVSSLLGKRAKRGLSITLLLGCGEIQTMSCDQIRKDIKRPYTTTIFVLLNGDPEKYNFRYAYNCPCPLLLRVAFLQCRRLVDDAAELDAFPLQTILLSQALLHLIVCLAEEAHQSPMEESLKAHYISRAKSLATKLKSIILAIKSLQDGTFEPISTSLREYFEEICEEHPGVVSVRQSFESFQALVSLDLRNRKTSHESPDTSPTAPTAVSHQDLVLAHGTTSLAARAENESGSSGSPHHVDDAS